MGLDKLFFYLIPGTIMLAGLLLVIPETHAVEPTLLAASALPLGYIIHSLERVVFEFRGGYHRENRAAIRCLKEIECKNTDELWQIWELARYSDEFPELLAKHTKRNWHVAHGLCTSIYACVFSAALIASKLVCQEYNMFADTLMPLKIGYFGFVVMGTVFWVNLAAVWKNIYQLEASVVRKYGQRFFGATISRESLSAEIKRARIQSCSKVLLKCAFAIALLVSVSFCIWCNPRILAGLDVLWNKTCIVLVTPLLISILFAFVFSPLAFTRGE